MPASENFLIRRLPRTARKHLLDQCALFDLVLSDELSVRGQPLSHAHFPIDGFVSLVIDVDHYPALEVGMVGREAMLGAELLLGQAKAPWRALVQGPGHSWRIGAQALRRECATSPALLHLVQTSLLGLIRLMFENIGALGVDDAWLSGQMSALMEAAAPPLSVRRLEALQNLANIDTAAFYLGFAGHNAFGVRR